MRVLRCFADRARAQHDDGNTGKNVAVLHPVEDDEANRPQAGRDPE
jgi:hypothetical protein